MLITIPLTRGGRNPAPLFLIQEDKEMAEERKKMEWRLRRLEDAIEFLGGFQNLSENEQKEYRELFTTLKGGN